MSSPTKILTDHERDVGRSADHDLVLDWLRGIAAVLVFIGHVRIGFFVNWINLDPTSQTPISYLLFSITRLGQEAVIVFFVLSGYLVGGQAAEACRNGRYSLSHYIVARVSRLYVVVLPALLLTGLMDLMHDAWSSRDALYPLLVNVLFLQGIFGRSYGSNAPLWSLSYEWWFYVLFGLSLTLISSASQTARAALAALLAVIVATLSLQCPQILLMFPLWGFGVAVKMLSAIRFRLPSNSVTSALAVAVLCIAMVASSLRSGWVGNFSVGVATAAFIYFSRAVGLPRWRWLQIGKRLAAFSFSLYALHYPLNLLVLSVLVPRRTEVAGMVNWLGFLLIVIVEAVVCWIFYWTFERRTPMVRAWLLRTLAIEPVRLRADKLISPTRQMH